MAKSPEIILSPVKHTACLSVLLEYSVADKMLYLKTDKQIQNVEQGCSHKTGSGDVQTGWIKQVTIIKKQKPDTLRILSVHPALCDKYDGDRVTEWQMWQSSWLRVNTLFFA